MQHEWLSPNRLKWRILLVFLREALGLLLPFRLVQELLTDRCEETVTVFDIGLGCCHDAGKLIFTANLRVSLAFRGLLVECVFE